MIRAHGYVHLPELLGARDLELLERAHARLAEEASEILREARAENVSLAEIYRSKQPSVVVVPERDNPDLVCRFEYLFGASAEVRAVLTDKIVPAVDAAAGESCVLFKDKCNEKNPGGGAFRPHQDVAAYLRFRARYHISAMVALDEATEENGCVQFAVNYRGAVSEISGAVEGMHGDLPLLSFYRGGRQNGDITDEVSAALKWIPVPAKRGDVVLFDSYVPHYSRPNLSQSVRRAMFFTFNPARDGYTYEEYYRLKRERYDAPEFHMSTPTEHSELRS
jgi:ectoine hydroxylase-related dioxygenase (phytanoyl-CoA dioxygenase family)